MENVVAKLWSFPVWNPNSPTSFRAERLSPPFTNNTSRVFAGLMTIVVTLVRVVASWKRMVVWLEL